MRDIFEYIWWYPTTLVSLIYLTKQYTILENGPLHGIYMIFITIALEMSSGNIFLSSSVSLEYLEQGNNSNTYIND